jgi:hypothetical protein
MFLYQNVGKVVTHAHAHAHQILTKCDKDEIFRKDSNK